MINMLYHFFFRYCVLCIYIYIYIYIYSFTDKKNWWCCFDTCWCSWIICPWWCDWLRPSRFAHSEKQPSHMQSVKSHLWSIAIKKLFLRLHPAWNSKAIDYWNGNSSEELQWHAADSLETLGWLQRSWSLGRNTVTGFCNWVDVYTYINRWDSWNESEHESWTCEDFRDWNRYE